MAIRIILNPEQPLYVKGELVQVKPELYEYTDEKHLQLMTVGESFTIEPLDTRLGQRLVNVLLEVGYLVPNKIKEIEVGPYDSDWSTSIRFDETPK